jgi:hypothetical protein
MFFLNLSPAEFLLLFGGISGLAVTLYLLDRSRRKQVVPTLRFWHAAEQPVSVQHRRRIQQPWSLLLQLIAMTLLLLALAQLRFGSPEGTAPEHIVLLDTSSWMAARSRSLPRERTLMDEARRLARQYVAALPGSNRVMIVRTDALATPATGMESDRPALNSAIDRSAPSATALNLGQAFDFARQFQKLHTRRPGEIVYIGPGRISDPESGAAADVPALRVIPVDAKVENVGLRRIGLRRSPDQPGRWDVFVSVRNHGVAAHEVPVSVKFGGAPVGSGSVRLAPGADQDLSIPFRTKSAGWIEVRLLVNDDLAEDDRALLEIPDQKSLRVAVFSNEPDLLKPLFAGNPRVEARYLSPGAYSPKPDADIVVLDRFRPPQRPEIQAIWIEPPRDASPVPVRSMKDKVALTRWRTDHPLGAGLRARDVQLDATAVFEPSPADIPIAEVDGGPVILARPGTPRQVAIGFHPMRSALRYELVTPLLFANILRWMEPDSFATWELNAAAAGAVNVELERGLTTADVKVTGERNNAVPFSLRGRNLHLFSGEPGMVRVKAGERDIVYSLTLPEVGDQAWTPPASARKGVPAAALGGALSRDVWHWLAALAGVLLAIEWILFGRGRLQFMPRAAVATLSPLRRIWARPAAAGGRKAS